MRGCVLAVVCQSVAASLLDSGNLHTKLQAIADAKAKQYDCAIAIGVQTGTESIAVASRGSAVTDRFVWGSVTKQFTGVALLQLAEAGTLDLDAPVQAHLDPMLARLGLRGLTALFGKDASKITARHLASMQSGVPDFDTAQPYPRPPTDAFRAEVYAKPTHDWGPAGLINQVRRTRSRSSRTSAPVPTSTAHPIPIHLSLCCSHPFPPPAPPPPHTPPPPRLYPLHPCRRPRPSPVLGGDG